MKSCLNQNELNLLLDSKLHHSLLCDDLANRYDLAERWCESLGILTYLFARILENCEVKEELINYIDTLYDLPDIIYLEIQEIDYKYVSLLMGIVRQPDFTLEDELVDLHATMIAHDYTRIIRY